MTKKNSPTIKRRRITFQYENPEAKQVFLVGNFNGWHEKKHPMKNDGTGRWEKNVLLLPGMYEYKFIVDGQWKKDPVNKASRPNSFGTSNSVLKVDLK